MPPLLQAVAQAYRDLGLVFRALSVPAAIACIVSGVGNILEGALVAEAEYSSRLLIEFLSNAAQQVLITPFLIGVHRFIILGETHNTYRLDISAPRFQRYFWITGALVFLNYLASYLAQFALLVWPSLSALDTIAVIQTCVFVALLARLVLVFPMVAVDAPDANLTDALANTAARFWTILLLIVTSLASMFVALAGVAWLLQGGAVPQSLGIIANLINGTIAIVMMALLAVIGSRLYLTLDGRAAGA
jgi:hypothetical protein